MSLSDVEKLMDETADAIAYQNEIDELLSTRLSEAEVEDIERELDALVEAEMAAKLPAVPTPSTRELEAPEEEEPEEEAVVPVAQKKKVKSKPALNEPMLA
ncbi:hypothetical protein BGZ52_007469 [Haplosporangium bisporale]|nr:hypothetical protein BGZ52_007469 [Haplosporangium bisporale]